MYMCWLIIQLKVIHLYIYVYISYKTSCYFKNYTIHMNYSLTALEEETISNPHRSSIILNSEHGVLSHKSIISFMIKLVGWFVVGKLDISLCIHSPSSTILIVSVFMHSHTNKN